MDGDGLDALLADAVATEAARDRSRERMLRQAAEEEATVSGALVGFAEAKQPLAVRVTGGRAHRGVVTGVARDFFVLVADDGRVVVMRSAAVTSMRVNPSRGLDNDVADQREPPVRASLRALLAALAGERPVVQIGVAGEDVPLRGILRSVGEDVLTLQVDGGGGAGGTGGGAILVPLAAVVDVVLLER